MGGGAFGTVVAQALAGLLVAGAAVAAEQPAAKAGTGAAKINAKTMKCVHNCTGYAQCIGNGNNACKGQNKCANHGLVPKECSSQTTKDACLKVVDAKKSTMCTWQEV